MGSLLYGVSLQMENTGYHSPKKNKSETLSGWAFHSPYNPRVKNLYFQKKFKAIRRKSFSITILKRGTTVPWRQHIFISFKIPNKRI